MGADDAKTKSVRDIFRDVVLVFVAAPASFALLGKVDDRFDFSEPLKRIILSFEKVSENFWALLADLLPIRIPIDHALFSFLTLFVVPSIVHMRISLEDEDFARNKAMVALSSREAAIWMLLGLVFVVLYALFFSPSRLGSVMFVAVFILLVALLLRVFFAPIFPFWRVIVLPPLVVSLAWLFFGPGDVLPVGVASWVYNILFALSAVIVFVSLLSGFRGPAVITLASLGVVAVDWSGRVFLPAIGNWLTSIGA